MSKLVYRSEAPLTLMQELCANPSISWDNPYEELSESERDVFNAWIDSIRYDEYIGDYE